MSRPRQAVPPVTDIQVTTAVATVPAAVKAGAHLEVGSTEATIATSLLPVINEQFIWDFEVAVEDQFYCTHEHLSNVFLSTVCVCSSCKIQCNTNSWSNLSIVKINFNSHDFIATLLQSQRYNFTTHASSSASGHRSQLGYWVVPRQNGSK